jgi:hypothetical protein
VLLLKQLLATVVDKVSGEIMFDPRSHALTTGKMSIAMSARNWNVIWTSVFSAAILNSM